MAIVATLTADRMHHAALMFANGRTLEYVPSARDHFKVDGAVYRIATGKGDDDYIIRDDATDEIEDNRPHQGRTLNTVADCEGLSYYTLCRLSETTGYAMPHKGLPGAIGRGEFKGMLTLDSLGNFVSFE